ncbi:Wzz/FepE/Etk N-terminal domain-containing protein, partial [Roseicyclus sp.]|uniref:Wzz/FepE/Etk N-terminal domain-containing protein n=1 Tax=Roseicyclus sp. TaxID=1914329 RepID=UPI001BCF90FD
MSDQQFDDEIDLGELLLTILGEWRLVASVFIGAVLFSAVYAFAIAPTQYRAEASLRGIAQAYCPPSTECPVTLDEALAGAVALVSTPQGFASLDAALNLSADDDFAHEGDFAAEEARRNFLEAVNVQADSTTALISVTHSHDLRAVDLANAIAEFVASEVALSA